MEMELRGNDENFYCGMSLIKRKLQDCDLSVDAGSLALQWELCWMKSFFILFFFHVKASLLVLG
jgi:hypothetical protein